MYHTLVFCSECANLVKCFAGNRDLPLLHLFLIASLILPREILLTYRLYPNHRSLFIRCLWLSTVARGTEGNRGEKLYIFLSVHMVIQSNVNTALLTIPRWFTVRV